MSDPPVQIPNRALFKAAEVCEIARLQPYVLRSWEAEFPELGVQKTAGAPRIYRRRDVERVLRIKHLLLVDGLTLAGARRKLEGETTLVAEDGPLDDLLGRNARERIGEVVSGLRSLLELLSSDGPHPIHEYELTPPTTTGGRPIAERVKAAAEQFGHGRKGASKGSSKPVKSGRRKHAPA
ncbi:MAG TPA: MerR family transcriptional regulator [Vicinamibacterales bacterium]|nr:MerR family transcriptional regulator [Vicinamibacterales bacterium]